MNATESRVRLDRWSGAMAGAVVLAAASILKGEAALLVGAAVPAVYLLYGSLDRVALDPDALSVERVLERESAFPGDRIDVELRVENASDRPLADLRVVDGVPDEVAVVEGSPRDALALRPGESATVEYTVVARRGDHQFRPAKVRARSTSGTDVVTLEVTPDGATSLTCRPDLETVPLARQTQQFAGTIGTDVGGTGVEFHSTREYRRGDPVSRIDWRELAKRGELTTVNYREHRSARIVVAVDARDCCYVAPTDGAPTGAAMCGYGGRRVFELLRGMGHEVGAAGFGLPDRAGAGGPAWVSPGHDEETRLQALDLFDAAAETPRHLRTDEPAAVTARRAEDYAQGSPRRARRDPAGPRSNSSRVADGGKPGDSRDRPANGPAHFRDGDGRARGDPTPRDGTPERDSHDGEPRGRREPADGYRREPPRRPPGANEGRRANSESSRDDPIDVLCGRLSANAQLLFFTPALDSFPEEVVRTVTAYGHDVTVVSPDVTTDDSPGGRLNDVERTVLLEDLRAGGATVVDWKRERPLALTLASILEGI